MTYSLALYENPALLADKWLADLTGVFQDPKAQDGSGWRRSIADVGGYLYGESPFKSDSPWMMKEFFLDNLFRQVKEFSGGEQTWSGIIAEMTLTYSTGESFIRSIVPVANAVKTIYSKIGDNQLSDGGAESSSWTQIGSPSTFEFTSDWYTQGTQGCHVITDSGGEGVEIEGSLSITANVAYEVQVSAQVESGAWTLYVYAENTSTIVAEREITASGGERVRAQIPDSNETTTVDIQVKAAASGAEIYLDGAVVQESPRRADTTWYVDAASISEYGRKELVILERGRTTEAAEALAQTELYNRAYPRTRPPDTLETLIEDLDRQGREPAGLVVGVYGDYHTLKWRHTATTDGSAGASTQLEALINESEFITAGYLESNTTSYQVNPDDPMTLWDHIEDLVRMGDGSTPWQGGVYNDREFEYEARSTSIDYYWTGGQLLHPDGSPVEPWLARPGLVRITDMPVRPDAISNVEQDHPANVWISEVEFAAPNSVRLMRERDARR